MKITLPWVFNPVIARDLCLLSDICYDTGKTITVNGLAFLVREMQDYTELIFQGSNDLHDAYMDAKAALVSCDLLPGFGHIHDGFEECLQDLAQPVLSVLNKAKTLRIAGHSLGAGEAILMAAWLRTQGFRVEVVYLFGCPGIGDGAWITAYQGLGIPTFEVVHGCDGVTLVPPWAGHAGKLIFLDLHGNQIQSRLSWAWWNPLRWFARAADHSIDKYQVCLDKLALQSG